MIKILHFADAHIDIANHGRQDPQTGLSLRAMDFLKALDAIVDTAIERRVDLVIFAGDAYRDRTPVPTFQREWGRRILRLSREGILTLLLVGNHDLSPAVGRANALQEFDTLAVPHVRVLDKPRLYRPEDLENLPLQVLALPWLSRSRMMAALEVEGTQRAQVFEQMGELLGELIEQWLERDIDPDLPVILTAHASVQGAKYGGERSVMLGSDVVLPPSLVKDQRLDYVALGHIHKAQDLNPEARPPVVYPGSIERVDFGEAADDKYFVIVTIDENERKRAEVEWVRLEGRSFIDRFVRITSSEDVTEQLFKALPTQDALKDAIVRLSVEYPREVESLLDEQALRRYAAEAFEFHFVRRPQMEARLRLPESTRIASLSALELLEHYWHAAGVEEEIEELNSLAAEIIGGEQNEN
ncbi:MAG: exonuclease SbcCD subunit D [Anaerolineales bacterium]|nr:exonuclease SbcCD subunit D [Anaerolineales bacterium]